MVIERAAARGMARARVLASISPGGKRLIFEFDQTQNSKIGRGGLATNSNKKLFSASSVGRGGTEGGATKQGGQSLVEPGRPAAGRPARVCGGGGHGRSPEPHGARTGGRGNRNTGGALFLLSDWGKGGPERFLAGRLSMSFR